MLESRYSSLLNKRLEAMFPGCVIQKLDANLQQGIPDKLILWNRYWAILEVKAKEPRGPQDFQPNQEWWIEHLDNMSFAACIYPENEEEVLHDLEQAFRLGG